MNSQFDFRSDRGAAMVTAVIAAIVAALSAALVLGVSMRQFEMAKFRSDRLESVNTTEGITRYIWLRLQLETDPDGPGPERTLADLATDKAIDEPFVLFPDTVAEGSITPDPPFTGLTVDLNDNRLIVSGKEHEVHVIPIADPDNDPPPHYQVIVHGDYGARTN